MISTDRYCIYNCDNLLALAALPDACVDSIVTDPPYGLAFMGKKWDCDVPTVALWAECMRVLKPGGHLLAFSGTRTHHRMAVRIEDAGFEIRDMIAWVYGSGFPKSLDVSKAVDKSAGDAKPWQGWGTAIKPALEPITVARKPFRSTVAENVMSYGTGALNIDACRIGGDTVGWRGDGRSSMTATAGASRGGVSGGYNFSNGEARQVQGRYPTNLIHDGSPDVVSLFPGTDDKSAARFFYCAKASKRDRDEGLEARKNNHPTVKPCDLMRYLCRLVTPPGGTVLDPFMGSGSTGKAAMLEGFRFVGMELDESYFEIAAARIGHSERKAA